MLCDVWKAFRCSLETCVARVHQRPKFLWLAPSPALANRFLGGARAQGGRGMGAKITPTFFVEQQPRFGCAHGKMRSSAPNQLMGRVLCFFNLGSHPCTYSVSEYSYVLGWVLT